MSKYGDEKVLVIPRELFNSLGAFQGVCVEDPARYLEAFFAPGVASFMLRAEAEENPNFKQIIPYVLFSCKGKWLCYTRGGSGGEARLHDKGSMGIGGHINPVDDQSGAAGIETYLAGVERELSEEITWNGLIDQRILGLINDDSNEVGAVHLGIIHHYEIENEDVFSNEEAIATLAFYTLDELQNPEIFDRLETWSQLSLKALIQL